MWVTLGSASGIHKPDIEVGKVSAPNQEQTPEKELSAAFLYYLSGDGLWKQDGTGADSGNNEPLAYFKRYEWGPQRAMVFDDTFALMKDGSCRQWTHNVFVWDHQKKGIRGYIFHSAGFQFTVDVELGSAKHRTAELRGVLPNGSEIRMRDETDISDPQKTVIHASAWNGKDWTEHAPVSWVRISRDSDPCKLATGH